MGERPGGPVSARGTALRWNVQGGCQRFDTVRRGLRRDRAYLEAIEWSRGHGRSVHRRGRGGVGLFMIALMADRWGTRYSPSGNTIWAEWSGL